MIPNTYINPKRINFMIHQKLDEDGPLKQPCLQIFYKALCSYRFPVY